MELFTIEGGITKILPQVLTIQEFSVIWNNDSSVAKDRAIKELSLVYFMCDYKSPYIGYPDSIRLDRVIKDVYGAVNNVEVPDRILNAINKYNELQVSSSPSMALLKSSQQAINKITEFLDTVNLSDDAKGSKMSTLIKALSSIDSLIKGLSSLEIKVANETQNLGRVRGGGQIGNRELPREKRERAK